MYVMYVCMHVCMLSCFWVRVLGGLAFYCCCYVGFCFQSETSDNLEAAQTQLWNRSSRRRQGLM